MKNKLSYSQLRLYSECGMKYKYYYKDKLREKTRSGALCFGSAFDKATEAVLKDPSVNEYAIFDKMWEQQYINKGLVKLIDSTLITYAQSDYDEDLLTEEDKKFALAKTKELVPDLYDLGLSTAYLKLSGYKKQKAFRHFKESENKLLNIFNWLSLRRKGYLMLKAHREKVLPKIKAIKGVQVKVDLDNGEGDTLIGYADLIATWEDGHDCVIDYKTSAIEYDENSVITSPQLTIYSHSLGISRAGYVVFRKSILKNKVKTCSKCGYDGSGGRHKSCNNTVNGARCEGTWKETISPEVDIQFIFDDIPKRTEDIVIENIDSINKAIKAEVFVRNFNSCKGTFGLCPYIKLCYKDDKSDLENG